MTCGRLVVNLDLFYSGQSPSVWLVLWNQVRTSWCYVRLYTNKTPFITWWFLQLNPAKMTNKIFQGRGREMRRSNFTEQKFRPKTEQILWREAECRKVKSCTHTSWKPEAQVLFSSCKPKAKSSSFIVQVSSSVFDWPAQVYRVPTCQINHRVTYIYWSC